MEKLQQAYLQAISEMQPYARGMKLVRRAEEIAGEEFCLSVHLEATANLGKLVRTQTTKKGVRYHLSDAGLTELQQSNAPDRLQLRCVGG